MSFAISIADLARNEQALNAVRSTVTRNPHALRVGERISALATLSGAARAASVATDALAQASAVPGAPASALAIAQRNLQVASAAIDDAQRAVGGMERLRPMLAVPPVGFDASPAAPHLEAARDAMRGARLALDGAGIDTTPRISMAAAPDLVPPAIAAADAPWVAQPTPIGKLLSKAANGLPGRLLGIRAHGAENVPKTGAFILAPTHDSHLDLFYHLAGHKRDLRVMMKEERFAVPGINRLQAASGAFPVARGNGRAEEALTNARGMLATGQAIAMYPEGRIVRGAHVGEPGSGVARLALEMDVPVVPMVKVGAKPPYVHGKPWPHRPHVDVVYGEPISFHGAPATRENVAAAREVLWRATTELQERANALHVGHSSGAVGPADATRGAAQVHGAWQ